MNTETGEIEVVGDFTNEGSLTPNYIKLSELETLLLEEDPALGEIIRLAWNEYIKSRPKTSTIEKVKMRQAFIVGFKAGIGHKETL